MIIPKVGVMIAEQVTKIPPKYLVDNRKRTLEVKIWAEYREKAQKIQQRKEQDRTKEEQKFLNEGWKKIRDQIDEQKRVIDENYQKKYRNMTRLAMILSRVSPTSSMVWRALASISSRLSCSGR